MTERETFLAVLDLPEGVNRATFLETACGGDPTLRVRIELLRRSHATLFAGYLSALSKCGPFLATTRRIHMNGLITSPRACARLVNRPAFRSPSPRH
jgi:hypothetical protein